MDTPKINDLYDTMHEGDCTDCDLFEESALDLIGSFNAAMIQLQKNLKQHIDAASEFVT